MLNEVNTIREKMGLQPLNEVELLELQISKLDPENLDEGLWEKIKGMLPNTVYKKGGVALAKLKMKNPEKGVLKTIAKAFNPNNWELETRWGLDKANAQKIQTILKKENNGIIRDLDKQIKEIAPDFPNTTDQLLFVQIVSQIGSVYDTIVARAKLDPNDKDFMTDVQANDLINDLKIYVNRFLDYDLSAKFSVFNEEEEGADSDVIKEDTTDLNDNDALESIDEGIASSLGRAVGKFQANRQAGKNRQADIDYEKTMLAAKGAQTKKDIAQGKLQAYDSTRMNTLKSWNLPVLMGFSGLGWLIKGILTPDEVVKGTKEVLEKTIENKIDTAITSVKPGDGWTQTVNAAQSKVVLTPKSTGKDVAEALKAIGGGNLQTGIDATTGTGPTDLCNHAESKGIITQVTNPNSEFYNKPLEQTFGSKTNWAGTGRLPGDLMTIKRNGQIVSIIVNAVTAWKLKTVATTATVAGANKKALMFMGKAGIIGAVALALLRYKGRRSSRAQILNDLMQRLRPVAMSNENPIDPDPDPNPNPDPKKQKQGSDLVLYNKLKNYFKDLYNFRSQVNKDTYGKGGTSNADKVYSGAGEVPSNLQVTPKDADDLLKLMESLQSVSEETLDDIGLSSNQLKLLKTNIEKLKQLMEMVKGFNSQDPKLNAMIQSANQNPVVSTKDLTIDNLLQSDAKSLKIFVSDFNKALYSVKFKNGNSIVDQLGKIQINKLKERAERVQSKGAMNKVYNDRRTFLANLPSYITTLYSIFSYLIDQMSKNPEGNKAAQADYLTGQKGGKESPGLTSTGKAEMNKGLNTGNSGGTFGGFRAAGQNLEEGSVLTKAEMIAIMIEEARVAAPEEGGEENAGQEQINQNGRHFKIMKSLAVVAPTYARTIAKAYNDMYPDDQKISSIKLGNYLTVTLNAIAFIPESRMKTYIKQGGGDMAAYIATLNRIDEANAANSDAIKQSANYKLMMSLSSVIPAFQSKITMRYNQQNPMDRLSAPKLVGFLQAVLMGAAMMPKNKMVQYIRESGGDIAMYSKALANITALEPGEEIAGGNFPVDTFKPDNVEGYDLSGQKDSFRIGLSKKAAEVISRQTDTKLDEKNMLSVMKILIDTLNKKYLRPDKQIPMTGQQPA